MRLLYSLGISLYASIIQLAALFGNSKAKLWVNGRHNWTTYLKKINPKEKPLFWVHAASLGEFEQARPVIEKLKKHSPDCFILLSFFSPSGFEIIKNYPLADRVIYLPTDSRSNAKKFLDIIDPKAAIFIKYEFWFNYLRELKRKQTPTYLVSGIFRPSQHFFQFYGAWFRKNLSAFHHFFVQNEISQQLLHSIDYQNSSVTGDTRLDRVITISETDFSDQRFESFCANHQTLVFGSSWEAEHELIKKLLNSGTDFKIIIAPHEIQQDKIAKLKNALEGRTCLLSSTQPQQDLSAKQILIIDEMGLLSKIYRYAHIAFIGGGFGVGIHNLLEAAVYGCPVIFGPNHQKAQEAQDLIQLKGGFEANSFEDLQELLQHLSNNDTYKESQQNALEYVSKNKGASEKVVDVILQST